MKLLIRQRVFSWSDTYDVYDEDGQPKYYVRAEILSLGHQIHIYAHATGQEVGMIKEKLLTFMPKFEIYRGDSCLGLVEKQFTWFRPRYQVDYQSWQVEGDFLGWDYQVTDGSRTVMTISKEPFHWGDTYVLNVQNPAYELPGLLLVIAIDAANCDS